LVDRIVGNFELDEQLALSEYYFSEGDEYGESDEDNSTFVCFGAVSYQESELGEILFKEDLSEGCVKDYYGYSSGSDLAMDVFLATSDSDMEFSTLAFKKEEALEELDEESTDENEVLETFFYCEKQNRLLLEELEKGPMLFRSHSLSVSQVAQRPPQEETLCEQLAKITPQILAAISVAAKHLRQPQSASQEVRLEDWLDTGKLSRILSRTGTGNLGDALRIPSNAGSGEERLGVQMAAMALRSSGSGSQLWSSAPCDVEALVQLGNHPVDLETDEGEGEEEEEGEEEFLCFDEISAVY